MKKITALVVILFIVVISASLVIRQNISKAIALEMLVEEETDVAESNQNLMASVPSETPEPQQTPPVEVDQKQAAIAIFEQRTQQLNEFGASIRHPNTRDQDLILRSLTNNPAAFDKASIRFQVKASKPHQEDFARAQEQEKAFKELEAAMGKEDYQDYLVNRHPQPKSVNWPQLPEHRQVKNAGPWPR